jgi:hypothetical protein
VTIGVHDMGQLGREGHPMSVSGIRRPVTGLGFASILATVSQIGRSGLGLTVACGAYREGVVKSARQRRGSDNPHSITLMSPAKKAASKPKLLSGGNPQIPKGGGDVPVQAYIEAMPGWKSDLGRRLDALIVGAVPNVQKAVKWNSPFYGMEDDGWFLNFHCFTKYIKVAFFRGMLLDPIPPGVSKSGDTRYLDIREDEELDEKQIVDWVKQASKLPGEKL